MARTMRPGCCIWRDELASAVARSTSSKTADWEPADVRPGSMANMATSPADA